MTLSALDICKKFAIKIQPSVTGYQTWPFSEAFSEE